MTVKRSKKRIRKRMRKSAPSFLQWLAGKNKPNALGYTMIDPARWTAMCRIMDKGETK